MTFSIRTIDVGDPLQGKCETIFGNHKELVPLMTTFWARDAYESQWINALQALTSGRVGSCVLITDIQPQKDSSGVTFWAMYREEENVFLQEQFSRDQAALLAGPAELAEPHIPARIQGTTEEQSQVSEWVLSIDDLRQFVEKTKTQRNS